MKRKILTCIFTLTAFISIVITINLTANANEISSITSESAYGNKGVYDFAQNNVFASQQYCKTRVFDETNYKELAKKDAQLNMQLQSCFDNGAKLCCIKSCEYYVSETCDKNGNVIDSHVMTNREVAEQKRKMTKFNAAKTTSSEFLEPDSGSSGKLSMTLSVVKYSNGIYQVLCGAKWNTNSKVGGKNYPDAGNDDYLGITWGGNQAFVSTFKECWGKYQNGKDISFSRAQSDSYKGYCWRFLEKSSGLGSCMRDLHAEVKLKKKDAKNKKKQTNVKAKYIHTYGSTKGSISFTAGKNNAACGITLSKEKKQWPLELDVKPLYY